MLFLLVVLNAIVRAALPDLDTTRFREWGHEEWKAFVLSDPEGGRDFGRAKLDALLREERDVVHPAYALGLAEYLLGRHLISNNWYTYALEQPNLMERQGPIWSDEETALRKESALHNNIGINCEIMGDLLGAEEAYAMSRAIDLRLGETDAAWLTAINLGLLRFREHQHEAARELLEEAVEYFAARGDARNEGRALLNLAVAEQQLPTNERASQHAREAFAIFEALEDSTEAVRALITAGQFLDSRGEHRALGDVLKEIERLSPERQHPQVLYSGLVLEASHALHQREWDHLSNLLDDIVAISEQYPDLPRSDTELELRIAAALAHGNREAVLGLFRQHNQSLREQFGNKSAALLAEAWEVNDREEQLHRNEQLQMKLRFAQRLNGFGGLTLLSILVALGIFIWKRKSDARSQLVIVRLLRRHLARRSGATDSPSHQLHDNGRAPQFKDLFAAVEELVSREGIHRNSSLSLGDVASLLNSNAKYVSQAIRQETSMSYPEYVNMLRVQDAQQAMLESESQGLSLDQIADQCGFGTRRTLYRQFTKYTGMPPGQFLKLSQVERAAHIRRSRV